MINRVLHLQAKYQGQSEGGFAKGRGYMIEVLIPIFGSVKVQACHGYDWKHIDGYRLRYRDFEDFLEMWKEIKVIRDAS